MFHSLFAFLRIVTKCIIMAIDSSNCQYYDPVCNMIQQITFAASCFAYSEIFSFSSVLSQSFVHLFCYQNGCKGFKYCIAQLCSMCMSVTDFK